MSKRSQHRWIVAIAVLVAFAAILAIANRSSAAVAEPDPRLALAQANQQAYCADLTDDATTTRQRNTRADLCAMWTRQLEDLTPATPTPSASATSTPPTTTPPAPTTTAPPVTSTSTAPPTTTTSTPPPPSGWPGAANTGYAPTGVTLTDYAGPCLISVAGTVIDGKRVNCVLVIQATNVTIRRSWLLGISGQGGASFLVEDSTIDVTPNSTAGAVADGISGTNFTARRVNVFGSNRGIYCERSGTVQDSWIHGTEIDPNSTWHASAVRVEQYCTLDHNTLACDIAPTPADGGCSADQTMYPDAMTNHHNTITRNLYVANPGSAFCGYYGDIPSKPYGGYAENATYIVVTDNVFQRGPNGKCAAYGPADSWGAGRTGNVWSNNRFDDGTLYIPDEQVAYNNTLRRELVS